MLATDTDCDSAFVTSSKQQAPQRGSDMQLGTVLGAVAVLMELHTRPECRGDATVRFVDES